MGIIHWHYCGKDMPTLTDIVVAYCKVASRGHQIAITKNWAKVTCKRCLVLRGEWRDDPHDRLV